MLLLGTSTIKAYLVTTTINFLVTTAIAITIVVEIHGTKRGKSALLVTILCQVTIEVQVLSHCGEGGVLGCFIFGVVIWVTRR